jgi:hypothetical protein
MKPDHVRVAIDIPESLYQRLKDLSDRTGQPIPELILAGIEKSFAQERLRTARRVRFPLFGSDGPKINLTNEKIYKLVDFP